MTLEFFREGYKEIRGVSGNDIEEAFMAGAHTVVLMLKGGDSIENIDTQVASYLEVKQLEVDFEHNTIQ
jgi:hypothetical protein